MAKLREMRPDEGDVVLLEYGPADVAEAEKARRVFNLHVFRYC